MRTPFALLARSRTVCLVVGLAILAGCETPRAHQPIEYLNEQTGATITAVEKPLVFVRRRDDWVKYQLENFTVAATSVNRGGKRDYLLCVYVWSTMDLHDEFSADGTILLALVADERRIEFTDIGRTPADFGIAHPAGAPPWAPQPQISAVSQFFRARYFVATAVAAAVRSAVSAIESMMASGRPLEASLRTRTPWIVGSPWRVPLCGKLALALAAK